MAAAAGLGGIGTSAFPHLLKALENPQQRVTAAYGLQFVGPAAKSIMPKLVKLLKHEDSEVSKGAGIALGRIGKPALPALSRALGDRDKWVRLAAARGFAKMGSAAKPAVPLLLRALQDKWEYVRSAAATTLGQLPSAARKTVPHLIRALNDSDSSVRQDAVGALGALGPAARRAVPALKKLAGDESLKDEVEEALEKIEKP